MGSLPQSALLSCVGGTGFGQWDSPVDGQASSLVPEVAGVLLLDSGQPMWALTADLVQTSSFDSQPILYPHGTLANQPPVKGILSGRLVALQTTASASPQAYIHALTVRGTWIQGSGGQGLFKADLIRTHPGGAETLEGRLTGVFQDPPYAGMGVFESSWYLCD